MKELEATRRNKDALVAHFSANGTKENIPAPLNRLNPSVIEDCWNYFQRRKRTAQFNSKL